MNTALSRDWCLIFEALRRLIEGTCCLQGEEQVCAWDLFYRVSEAFAEHVRVEERWIFSDLPDQKQSERRREHLRLGSLISKARGELENSYGDGFRAVLSELVRELKAHHENDRAAGAMKLADPEPRKDQDKDLDLILSRSDHDFL